MYAPPRPVPVVVAPRRGTSVGPLLGISCLLLIGFLIAATIVLALIPVYLPRRGDTNTNSVTYNYQGSTNSDLGSDGDFNGDTLGAFNNPIAGATGLPQGAVRTVRGAAATGGSRKRRAMDLIRPRRFQTEQAVFDGVVRSVTIIFIRIPFFNLPPFKPRRRTSTSSSGGSGGGGGGGGGVEGSSSGSGSTTMSSISTSAISSASTSIAPTSLGSTAGVITSGASVEVTSPSVLPTSTSPMDPSTDDTSGTTM